MIEKELAQEISKKYGTVKRCRGPFLYTQKGERLTDLFQEKGRSILGWGKEGSSAFTILKNVLDRGITGSFETDFGLCSSKKCPSRLSKSCSELFASPRNAFLFNSKELAKSFIDVSNILIDKVKSTVYKKVANPKNSSVFIGNDQADFTKVIRGFNIASDDM